MLMETSAFFYHTNMIKYFLILLSVFSVLELSAQTTLNGKVTDANTGELYYLQMVIMILFLFGMHRK